MTKDSTMRLVSAMLLAVIFFLATPAPAYAATSPVRVVLTTDLPTQAAAFAFDFVDGGKPDNSATIEDFSSNGVLGDDTLVGSVTGFLPGTLTFSDAAFFSEYLQNLTLGSKTSFSISATEHVPAADSFPDSLSLFLLNAAGNSLVTSNDPTGANALLQFNLGQSSSPIFFTGAHFFVSAQAIPEPNASSMLVAGLTAFAMVYANRKRIAA